MAVSLRVIKERQMKFQKIQTLSDFAAACGVTTKVMDKIVANIKYNTFLVKKKSGGTRIIEDPIDSLKYIQDKLNDYFQAIFFEQRPQACYGFCISHANEEPRNVVSNATRHMAQPYMLNVDFKDFFHQITTAHVEDILSKYTEIKDQELLSIINKICTYKGRLPMGAPTSPVLSNFAMIDLDHELMNLSNAHDIKYTRYADDLTFSADEVIEHSFLEMISDAISYAGIAINPQKIKFFDREDAKMVTGIIVREDRLELQPGYLVQLEREIEMYRDAQIVDYKYSLQSKKSLHLFKQEIQGKLNFAYMVCPEEPEVVRLNSILIEDIDFEFVSKSWLDAPYMT